MPTKPTKIFLSWSGARSKAVAEALRQWLPDVIQSVKPWMSGVDIGAGARWGREIEQELEQTQFGVLCLTSDNLSAPWVLFEAGAIAKSVKESRVCPFLLDLQPSQLPAGPLTQFQAKIADAVGTLALVKSINLNSVLVEGKLQDDALERAFNRCWPELETKLKAIEPSHDVTVSRNQIEMVEEILEISRRLDIRVFEREVPFPTFENLVARLSEREAMIFKLNFGLIDGRIHSLEEIGAYFGIKSSEVRQIRKELMDRLKVIVDKSYKG